MQGQWQKSGLEVMLGVSGLGPKTLLQFLASEELKL
jgi:hypothetical protein